MSTTVFSVHPPSAEGDGLVVRKRRNGRQQACELCKDTQLRRDHSMPDCRRRDRPRAIPERVHDLSPRKTSSPSKYARGANDLPQLLMDHDTDWVDWLKMLTGLRVVHGKNWLKRHVARNRSQFSCPTFPTTSSIPQTGFFGMAYSDGN